MSNNDHFLPLFLEAQPDLRAFIGAMVRDPVTREDVFQEVSMVLWKSFGKFDPARSFGAWARGVATKKIMEDRRLRARLPECISPEVLEAVAEAFEADGSAQDWQSRERALKECIDQLPPRSGDLVAQRYGQGADVDALAENMGMSIDAIYQTLSRLRRKLRDCVQRRLAQTNSFT